MFPHLQICRYGLLLSCLVLAAVAKNAEGNKKGKLRGYDLVNSKDPWYGATQCETDSVWQIIDSLGNRDGQVTKADWEKIELPVAHFDYFDKDADGVLDVHESATWWQLRRAARYMNLSEVSDPPRGHMKPLGAWKDPLPSADLEYHKPYPHPREFWHKHMDGYLPANLKGAQLGWPAMNWTKEVLAERFGWVEAKLEPKIEGRSNTTAFLDLNAISPNHRLSVSEYLRLEHGQNMYVVSIIPQAMAYEVAHPAVLLCGSRTQILDTRSKPPYKKTKHMYPHESNFTWMTHLFEANLWIGSGRTRSQFHYDKEWNVNCLLSGRKRWFFINPFQYDKELNWARGKQFRPSNPLNNKWTDWVYLDPDAVDLVAYAKMRNMDYYEMFQEAGDCIFIPYAMLHQVDKLDDGLQVAASWMFLPETIYDEEACQEAPLERDLPLAAMDTMYMYTGTGLIPQGYSDPLNFIQDVAQKMRAKGEKHLSKKRLTELVARGSSIVNQLPPVQRKQKIEELHKLLLKYAKDPEKGLHIGELTRVPLRVWAKFASEGDEEGPLSCDDGQEYHIQDDEEFERMRKIVEQELATVVPSKGMAKPTKIEGISIDQRVWPRERPAQKPVSGRNEL